MSSILSTIQTVFNAVIGMVGDVATAIAGTTTTGTGEDAVTTLNNPILFLFCVAIPLVGIGVAMFRRLLRSRG